MLTKVSELFTEIPKHFDPEKWGSEDAILQFNISGDEGGSWYATITDGNLAVSDGTTPTPSMTLSCDSKDILAIVNGELSAVSAFMQGRIKIDGNMSLAMKLQNILKA